MRTQSFKGCVPRTPYRAAPFGVALEARDVDLSRGTLCAWGRPKALATFDGAKSFYQHGCCTFAWETCVSVEGWLPTSNRIFVTGQEEYPEVASVSNCEVTYYRLGVPAPLGNIALSFMNSGVSKNHDQRAYVYTYVNIFDEEGPPSWPSTDETILDGSPVTISGFVPPPIEYGINRIRIYRTATGYRDPKEPPDSITSWYLVAEIPATSTSFIDTIGMAGLGYLLETTANRPPPSGLQQIKLIDEVAVLVGFEKNRLHFSEVREPHNWPLRYEITLDDNIVGIAVVNSKVFVATTGHPYVIDGRVPEDDLAVRAIAKSEMILPMISCTFGGIIATPAGAVYAGAEGLVVLSESGPPQIYTQSFISSKQWQVMRPDTAVLGYYLGQVYCSTETDTYLIPLAPKEYNAETSFVSMASARPEQMQTSTNGQLLYLENGTVYQWNAGTKMPYYWKASTWQANARLTAVRIMYAGIEGPIKFTISSPYESATLTIMDETPCRLPRLGRFREFEIELEGTAEVDELGIGPTILETES